MHHHTHTHHIVLHRGTHTVPLSLPLTPLTAACRGRGLLPRSESFWHTLREARITETWRHRRSEALRVERTRHPTMDIIGDCTDGEMQMPGVETKPVETFWGRILKVSWVHLIVDLLFFEASMTS